MKFTLIPAICLLLFPNVSIAQSEKSQSSGYYQFQGATILTHFKGKAAPIIEASPKGFYVQKGKRGKKRMSWGTPCIAQPVFSVSDKLISIENLNYRFFYRKDAYHEEAAYHEMRLKNRETQHKIGMLQGTGNETAIASLIEEQAEFEDNMEALIQDGELKQQGHADSIELKMTLRPNSDIKGAYMAIMATHLNNEGELRVAVKVEWLGDLLKNIPEEISFQKLLGEGDYRNSRTEFYFFTKDSTPIPSNESNGLKELSLEELQRVISATERSQSN
ncbi:hypothetical protein [Pelagicoccus sp. SDUM812005]|uniref:hypothetical protein n=1 Tax=Pelagicoccus sp. SDUM812005 TaxID=3041257 RepID=UPI00280C8D84|nr:hypothetical protein [Pelagicoccus sp. SDUM812005]MDQ8182921.1 hypothetical protein [Pelagicoccus sp. SDUM812005]